MSIFRPLGIIAVVLSAACATSSPQTDVRMTAGAARQKSDAAVPATISPADTAIPNAPAADYLLELAQAEDPALRAAGRLVAFLLLTLHTNDHVCTDATLMTLAWRTPTASSLRGYAQILTNGISREPGIAIIAERHRDELIATCARDLSSDDVRSDSVACGALSGIDALGFIDRTRVGTTSRLTASIVCLRTGLILATADIDEPILPGHDPRMEDFLQWAAEHPTTSPR